MEEKKPRKRRQQRTYAAILDAARRIIREQGADQLSMRALAEQIDYSPAGLYEYFNSKEEILQAVCSQGHQLLHAALVQVDSDLAPAGYLHALGKAYIRFALANRDTYLLMFTLSSSSASQEEMLDEGTSFSVLLGAIRRGLETGVFKARPGFGLSEMGYAAWALVHGIAMLRLTHLRSVPTDFDAVDTEVLTAFGKGLQAEMMD